MTNIIIRMEMIKEDMKKDAEFFDGKSFNGKNVAEYLGRIGAAISVISNSIKEIAEEIQTLKNENRKLI